MSSRTKKDYLSVLQEILNLLVNECGIQEVMMDFERALWLAFNEIIPQAELKRCSFHLNQAQFRKLSTLGLSMPYLENQQVRNFCKRVMSFHLIPHERIVSQFYLFKTEVTENNFESNYKPLQLFMEYLDPKDLNSKFALDTRTMVVIYERNTNK